MIKFRLKNIFTGDSVQMKVDAPDGYETRLFTQNQDKEGNDIYDDDLLVSLKGITCRVFWSTKKSGWAVMYRMGGEKLYYKSIAWASGNCRIIESGM